MRRLLTIFGLLILVITLYAVVDYLFFQESTPPSEGAIYTNSLPEPSVENYADYDPPPFPFK